jgi:mono/diheme cytochrome c family protein
VSHGTPAPQKRQRCDYPVARGVAPPPGWPRSAAVRVPTALPADHAPVVRAVPRPTDSLNHWPLRLLFTAAGLLVLVVSAVVGYQVSQLTKQQAPNVARIDPAPTAEPPVHPHKSVAKAGTPPASKSTQPADAPPPKLAAPASTIAQSKPEARPFQPARPAPTFAKDVQPIFQAKCVTCHGNNNKRKGDLDLRTLDALHKGGESGSAVVRGQPDKSLLWESVEIGTMPPGKTKLSAAEKDTVRRWIEGGAK